MNILTKADFMARFNPRVKTVSFDKNNRKIVSDTTQPHFYEIFLKTSKSKKIRRYLPYGLTPSQEKKHRKILCKEVLSKKVSFVFTGLQKEKLVSSGISPEHKFYHLPLTKIKQISIKPHDQKKFDYAVVSSQNIIEHYEYMNSIQTKKWIAIGPETANLLKKKLNLTDVKTPNEYNATQAANLILDRSKKKGMVIWLGAKGGVIDGIEKLREKEFYVEVVCPYESMPLRSEEVTPVWKENKITKKDFLAKEAIWIFTSPLAAANYLKLKLYRENHFISCLGLSTAFVFFEKELIPYHIASKSTLPTLWKELNMS